MLTHVWRGVGGGGYVVDGGWPRSWLCDTFRRVLSVVVLVLAGRGHSTTLNGVKVVLMNKPDLMRKQGNLGADTLSVIHNAASTTSTRSATDGGRTEATTTLSINGIYCLNGLPRAQLGGTLGESFILLWVSETALVGQWRIFNPVA